MDIHHLCARLRERVAASLQQAADPGEKEEILIAALYEMSRSVLPGLGHPGRSPQYLQGQGAVLELISFLALRLIRGGEPGRRGVSVLSEIREGCLDPQLKKQLSVYAQELLAKSSQLARQQACRQNRWRAWLIGIGALAAIPLFFVSLNRPDRELQPPAGPAAPASAAASSASSPAVAGLSFPSKPAAEVADTHLSSGTGTGPAGLPALQGKQESVPAEHTTKVRIVNNQVLVPVTIEAGGQSVRLELVLDTGATRTALHDSVGSRLSIDLQAAKASQAEVADGRLILSRIARVDALLVGPYTMSPMELEFISYQGSKRTHDGLLGMDFLSGHRYQIDMERELVRWF